MTTLAVGAPLSSIGTTPLHDKVALPTMAVEEWAFLPVALDADNNAMVTAAWAFGPLRLIRRFIRGHHLSMLLIATMISYKFSINENSPPPSLSSRGRGGPWPPMNFVKWNNCQVRLLSCLNPFYSTLNKVHKVLNWPDNKTKKITWIQFKASRLHKTCKIIRKRLFFLFSFYLHCFRCYNKIQSPIIYK